jgi:hypothetical protein
MLRGMTSIRTAWLAAILVSLTACGGASPEPEEPAGEQTELPPDSEQAERPSMTAEECEAQGGQVVGDIGDGAIHRPEYRCESGEPPVGSIPLGVEGSVCCR